MAIITISRGSLSGGKDLAERLGEKLGYEVLSREVIVEAAKTYGVSEEKLIEGLEHPPGLWARFTGHADNYVLALQASLAEHITKGSVIYHGLAGRFLLADLPGVLRIRLIAPMAHRINAAAAQLGISRDQALAHIQKVDHDREKWVRGLHGEDWADPSHYDITINLGDMSMETAIGMVGCMISSKEFAWTDEVKQTAEDFTLKTRIRAHLRFRSRWASMLIQVEVNQGKVELFGDSNFDASRDEIEKFVQNIEGVTHLIRGNEEVPAIKTSKREVRARDIMIPITRYPHVGERVSLREAMVAISSSAVRLDDGFMISPRYVLVFDDGRNLVGVVSRRDLLRGLAPGYITMKHALDHAPGVFSNMAEQMDQTFAWDSLFTLGALNNAKEPVNTIMEPPKAIVNADDTLGVVVSAMLHYKVDLVPVVDHQRVTGVVLMTEIFDNVAQHIMEGGAR